MGESVLDLGQGLEIWRVGIEELREQDINARAMSKAAFDRLTATIAGDSRLESLPLCALTDNGLEIVSGHHRVRAARQAGLTQIWVMVDVTGLPRDRISSKQLAHNAIEGTDDPELVRRIFEAIGDVDARLESFIDPAITEIVIPSVQVDDIDLGLRYETVIIQFVPWERQYFEDATKIIERELQATNSKAAYLAELERFEAWQRLNLRIVDEYDIRTMSTVMVKIAELALAQLGEEPPEGEDWVPLRDVVGSAYIPAAAADTLRGAIIAMQAKGDIGNKNRWQALEYLAADYMAGAPPADMEVVSSRD